MFPYGDNLNGWYRAPVTVVLIVVMLAITGVDYVFGLHPWLLRYLGFIPILFGVEPWQSSYTLITASFLHGDIFHVAGNCLFLWVFGRSLERLLGWKIYAAAFPFLGIIGFLVQWATEPASPIVIVGASGAIAVLLGGYLALFPRARMRMIVLWLPFWKRFTVPAWLFLVYWIGLQLLSFVTGGGQSDGVAYAVHIGGFAAGVLGAVIWKTMVPSAEERLIEFTDTSFAAQPIRTGWRRMLG